MHIYFSTLGCKLNYTETSTLKRIAEQKGYTVTKNIEEANIIVVNTCTVTHTADKKSRYSIRHLHQQNPNAKIIVTGCYAEVEAEALKQMNNSIIIVGNNEKNKFADLLTNLVLPENNINHNEFFKAYSLGDRTRSFLKIQDGCNYYCSYCKVPFARGKSRNISIAEIIRQIKEIEKHDIKEIVLTGINIGDFGHSTNENFFELIKALEHKTNIPRYRISSIEPNLLSYEIIDFVLNSSRFVPHFHIPLQSGSNNILKAMNRRYDVSLFLDKVNYIQKKNSFAAIGIDIIVGFPGESEKDFEQTKILLESINFSYLHVFEYSDRKGTKASNMPNKIKDKDKKDRSAYLRNLSKIKHYDFAKKNLQSIRNVLFEKKTLDAYLTGLTDNYLKVIVPFDKQKINTITNVQLLEWNEKLNCIKGNIV